MPCILFACFTVGGEPGCSFCLVRSSAQLAAPTLSLRFEPNVGQTAPEARFVARGKDAVVFLGGTEAIVRMSKGAPAISSASDHAGRKNMAANESAILRIRPEKANANTRVLGLDRLQGKTNYFIGNNPDKWIRDLTGYGRVKYENVYPGIDLIYYGNDGGGLEYDFVVAPGANPELISVKIDGADDITVDASGDLVIETALDEVRQRRPRVYQQRWGMQTDVNWRYLATDHCLLSRLLQIDVARRGRCCGYVLDSIEMSANPETQRDDHESTLAIPSSASDGFAFAQRPVDRRIVPNGFFHTRRHLRKRDW